MLKVRISNGPITRVLLIADSICIAVCDLPSRLYTENLLFLIRTAFLPTDTPGQWLRLPEE